MLITYFSPLTLLHYQTGTGINSNRSGLLLDLLHDGQLQVCSIIKLPLMSHTMHEKVLGLEKIHPKMYGNSTTHRVKSSSANLIMSCKIFQHQSSNINISCYVALMFFFTHHIKCYHSSYQMKIPPFLWQHIININSKSASACLP